MRKTSFVAAQVNVASTADSINTHYGTTILSPGAGHSFASGLLDLRFWDVFTVFHQNLGIHVYGGASEYFWVKDSVGGATAVIGAAGATAFKEFADGSVGHNQVNLSFELGLDLRRIGGDIGEPANDDLRHQMLGTTTRTFWGPEAGLTIIFNNITAGIQAYWIFGKGVPGVTSGQIVAGIGIEGDVLQGPLKN